MTHGFSLVFFTKVAVLAVIQGVSELLPVSSSAHVIVAEKLMGLNPASPSMTLLLVMLHTGTMLAVIVYFWNSWKNSFFKNETVMVESAQLLFFATCATILVGIALMVLVEKVFLSGSEHPEIESLFGNLPLIAAAMAAAGALILWSGYREVPASKEKSAIKSMAAVMIGMVQGICLPFRGFSRSGATISTGLLLGIRKKKAEDFSFALAVIITPPVMLKEALRCFKAQPAQAHHHGALLSMFGPGLLGMALSFFAGLLALKWLSQWLEAGRWYLFGIYCLCASIVIFFLHLQGF